MAKTMIDIPDDFKNELIRRAAQGGPGIKNQILAALCEKWSWPKTRMPIDGRYKISAEEIEIPGVQFNGQTPRGKLPLDAEGLPDFDAAYEGKTEEGKDEVSEILSKMKPNPPTVDDY